MRELTLAEHVYDCLLGQILSETALDWVESIFTDGSEYNRNYAAVLAAYGRLCQRLGTDEEDDDVEVIINSMLDNEKLIALNMFELGMRYAKSESEKFEA